MALGATLSKALASLSASRHGVAEFVGSSTSLLRELVAFECFAVLLAKPEELWSRGASSTSL